MSEIKTVTHKGSVYKIGGVYEFSDSGKAWAVDELLSVGDCSIFPFNAREYEWELIREFNCTVGTITPVPVELIDGNAYMFDYKGRQLTGLCNVSTEQFLTTESRILYSYCKNIRLMTVESK